MVVVLVDRIAAAVHRVRIRGGVARIGSRYSVTPRSTHPLAPEQSHPLLCVEP
jgi:hypothetical protein